MIGLPPRVRGFALIELVAAMTIATILITIAYPSYREQIKNNRRAEAQTALLGLANAMNRHYTLRFTYLGTAQNINFPAPPLGTLYPNEAPLEGSKKYYDLQIQNADDSSYVVAAVPKNDQFGDRCGTLTINQTGQKGLQGQDIDVEVGDCWR
jgi:type IV pilus assembly protein PilE